MTLQIVEQDAEFADMRADEEREVREIEAKREEELVFTREMHRTARRVMQREFDRENDATRCTLSGLASELQFVQSLPCLAVVQPDLRREVGGAGGGRRSRNAEDGGSDDADDTAVSADGCCPICTRPYAPPRRNIFACRNGHSFCSECNANPLLNQCPMCRIDLVNNPPIRNRLAEQLIRRCCGHTVGARAAASNANKREE